MTLCLRGLSACVFAAALIFSVDSFSFIGNVSRIGMDDFDNDRHFAFLEITNNSGASYHVVIDEDTDNLRTGDSVQLELEPWAGGQTDAMAVPGSFGVQSWWKGRDVQANSQVVVENSRDGDRTILMIRICLRATCPSYTDADTLRKRMVEVDALARQSSFGRTGFPAGDVSTYTSVVDHDIKSYTKCDTNRAIKAAKAVLVEKRKSDPSLPDPSKYRHIAYFIPQEIPGCGWAGYAYVGGIVSCNRFDSVRVISHELGHNIGMWHAAADWNDDGVQDSEYGDPTSYMGAVAVKAVNALQRRKMGWIADQHVVRLDACGDSQLVLKELDSLPSLDPTGGKVIATMNRAISIGGGVYFFSYRDEKSGRKGVHVHYQKGQRNTQAVAFLDTSSGPWTGRGAGGSIDSTVTLSVEQMDASSATLHIKASCQTTTTTTYTGSTTTTTRVINGLTPDEAKYYNPKLSSYWDHGSCGELGDDYQWGRCGYTKGSCPSKVAVTSLSCRSGWMVLRFLKRNHRIDGCKYFYYAQYVCEGAVTSTISTTSATSTSSSSSTSTPITVTATTVTTTTTTTSTTSVAPSTTTAATTVAPPTTTTTTASPSITTTMGTSTSLRRTTTMTTTVSSETSTSSAPPAPVIQSGDTVFLITRSGTSNMIDVDGGKVQARWVSRGSWQAIVIEKEGGGTISAGDVVFLRTHLNTHIDVEGEDVQSRWEDHGAWQAMTIEKRFGSGPIRADDLVCFRGSRGKHLDVADGIVRARYDDCGEWQSMRIEKEIADAVFSGASISLLAHTGNRIDVEGTSVQARWSEKGAWQTFAIQNFGGRAIFSGDSIFLTAHTGKLLHVQGSDVHASWSDYGAWQTFTIEKDGGGAIMTGDTIFIVAHTGNRIEVSGSAVRARWSERGLWQSLIIEEVTSRRLSSAGDSVILV